MSCKCKYYLNSIGKPKNKIDCIAWLLLNVFGCKFCETCRDKPCNIKDGESCTDNIANYIREAVKEETPTADVVEVRHGYWLSAHEYAVKLGETNEIRLGNAKRDKIWHFCSLCEQQVRFKRNFCPECGAKMDGERRSQNE